MKAKIGIIGGSGLHDPDIVSGAKEIEVSTPFGQPSGKITIGTIGDKEVAFLQRHGIGHKISPSEINVRANIYALKKLGVTHIISSCTAGSLKEEIKPMDIVIPDQLFDRTRQRQATFFERGIVAHVKFALPFCQQLSSLLCRVISKKGYSYHPRGTYVCMEGPQFSTKAESNEYRRAGFDIIGMTAIPEAKLAREAEICYAIIATVTDYDVWKESDVDIQIILENMRKNVAAVRSILTSAMPEIRDEPSCECQSALDGAIVTSKDLISRGTRKRLDLLIGKYMDRR
jgi:5'-methylthioadenosine phosphorylase